MSLTCSGSHKPGLLHIAFNQDNSCIAIGSSEGIRIYHIDTHQICYRDDIGAVGCVERIVFVDSKLLGEFGCPWQRSRGPATLDLCCCAVS